MSKPKRKRPTKLGRAIFSVSKGISSLQDLMLSQSIGSFSPPRRRERSACVLDFRENLQALLSSHRKQVLRFAQDDKFIIRRAKFINMTNCYWQKKRPPERAIFELSKLGGLNP